MRLSHSRVGAALADAARVLTLYDSPASSNGRKLRLALAETGLDARRVEVALDEPRPAWYRAIHPFGLVPCLVDGDLAIPQSHAALRHLALLAGRDDLLPSAPPARVRVDVVLDSLSLEVRPVLWEAERVEVYGQPAGPPWRPALEEALDGFERLLGDDGWCVGDAPTIADCAVAGRLVHWRELPLEHGRWPRIDAVLGSAAVRWAGVA